MVADADPAAPAAVEKSKPFLRLFVQSERRVYAYILTLLPNRADAEDVLQDASLVMWDKFDPAAPPADFAAWACRIAYHKVLDACKRHRRDRVRLTRATVERVAEAAAALAAGRPDARAEALAGCVEKLGPRDRDLLARRYADGATTQTTSAATGRSVEAVYKAVAKLREALFDCVQRTLAREGRA